MDEGYVVFSNAQGMGYIFDSPDKMEALINPVPVTLNNKVINHGDFTTLDDYLIRPIKYIGMISEQEMVFFIGSVQNLFETKYYYQAIMKVDENRIFEMFSPTAGRDHLFVAGKWK
jgi:hypothetical protein